MDESTAETLATALPGIEVPVIGIVRRLPVESVVDAVTAAAEAGLRVVEITIDSEDALDQIHRVAEGVPAVTVGVGSVLHADQVKQAHEAGARFAVAPIVDEATIEAALDRAMAVLPGAASPTEILRALRTGATAVKVFPIHHLGGPGYLMSIRSPLGDPPLVPTGGVTAESAAPYLAAGAVAVGAGSDLFGLRTLQEGGVEGIHARAAAWVKAVS